MANKKSTSKKQTSSKKKTASKEAVKDLKNKSKKVEKEDHEAKIESVGDFTFDLNHTVRVVSIILLIFCVFYFLTVFLANKDSNSSNNTTTVTNISYTNIVAGRSFAMPEEEYLVLYYDTSDEENSTTIASSASSYRAKEEHLALYTVDMNDAMNKGYAKEESNQNPSSVSELAINGPTIIRFVGGEVREYIEGKDNVVNYLG